MVAPRVRFALAALAALLAGAPPSAAEAESEQTPPASLVSPEETPAPDRPLLYGLLTRHLPFQLRDAEAASASEDELARELELEAARSAQLEAQIEAEVRRQEELMQKMEQVERPEPTPDPLAAAALAARADPRVAPEAPVERELPLAIFDTERVTVPARTWENPAPLELVKRTLDADRDGSPEQVRFYRPGGAGEELLRLEQDRDFDGRLDSWSDYQLGALTERALDTDGDGRPDTWEGYDQGSMRERVIDRDGDGVRDAFYTYEAGLLVEERHDPDNDGAANQVVRYENRRRVRSEEDRDADGRIDTWTTWRTVDGEEIIARIERDTRGRGEPDRIETFTARDGRAVLSRVEEDKDGDGVIDITSFYENGKLVRREIADPSLVPL